jgi:hypothetical protein
MYFATNPVAQVICDYTKDMQQRPKRLQSVHRSTKHF